MSLRTENKIEYFYRYRHFDDPVCVEALQALLLESVIYPSSPLYFNDPYDCRPRYAIKGTDREVRAYLKKLHGENLDTTKNDVNRLVLQLMKKIKSDPFSTEEVFSERYHNALLQNVKMLCLAKSSGNILMWAHYASSHTGLCLEFKDDYNVYSIFALAQKVNYCEQYPLIDLTKCSEDDKLTKALLTKALDWQYECEHRIIFPGAPNIVRIPEESLTAVIFGLKTSEAHKDLVRKWISHRKIKPTLYQANMKRNEFGLEFARVDGK